MDKATRPNRGDLDDPDIKWRDGKPDYELADEAYFSGRSKAHKEGRVNTVNSHHHPGCKSPGRDKVWFGSVYLRVSGEVGGGLGKDVGNGSFAQIGADPMDDDRAREISPCSQRRQMRVRRRERQPNGKLQRASWRLSCVEGAA